MVAFLKNGHADSSRLPNFTRRKRRTEAGIVCELRQRRAGNDAAHAVAHHNHPPRHARSAQAHVLLPQPAQAAHRECCLALLQVP